MRLLNVACVAVMLGVALASCDQCKNLDCINDNFEGRFRILNTTGTSDRVFGPNSIYDKNEIRFYTLNRGDSSFLAHQYEK